MPAPVTMYTTSWCPYCSRARALLARKLGYLPGTDAAVVVARVFTIAFGVVGLAFGMYQLLLLAPFLWMMTTQEQRVAHMTAGHYAGGVEVMDHEGWDRRETGWGSPFDPRVQQRRFAIVNRNGRLVIEAID